MNEVYFILLFSSVIFSPAYNFGTESILFLARTWASRIPSLSSGTIFQTLLTQLPRRFSRRIGFTFNQSFNSSYPHSYLHLTGETWFDPLVTWLSTLVTIPRPPCIEFARRSFPAVYQSELLSLGISPLLSALPPNQVDVIQGRCFTNSDHLGGNGGVLPIRERLWG